MRKTFPLVHPKHQPARVLDKVKHEVRKYLKRERGKDLPEKADYWAFECRVGKDDSAPAVSLKELSGAIDHASSEGWESVYVEILAKPATRPPREPGQAADSSSPSEEDE